MRRSERVSERFHEHTPAGREVLGLKLEMLPDEARAAAAAARAAAARAAAAAEGLELVPSSSNQTGFRGVSKHVCGKYKAELKSSGKRYYLGMFATPEEAALRYARHVGAERAAAEAAEARVEGPQPL